MDISLYLAPEDFIRIALTLRLSIVIVKHWWKYSSHVLCSKTKCKERDYYKFYTTEGKTGSWAKMCLTPLHYRLWITSFFFSFCSTQNHKICPTSIPTFEIIFTRLRLSVVTELWNHFRYSPDELRLVFSCRLTLKLTVRLLLGWEKLLLLLHLWVRPQKCKLWDSSSLLSCCLAPAIISELHSQECWECWKKHLKLLSACLS